MKKVLSSLILFLLIIPFLFFMERNLEFLFQQEIEERTYLERATVRNKILATRWEAAKPIRLPQTKNFNLEAKSGLVLYLKKDGEKMLFEKEANKKLPIASLSKLMGVLVALEEYHLEQTTVLSKKAGEKEGGPNFFEPGQKFSVRTLLQASLAESSNRAMFALSEIMGEKVFVQKMNNRAKELGMEKTRFFNPTGLDPDSETETPNLSSARDLAVLAKNLLDRRLVKKAARKKAIVIYDSNGNFHHNAFNTNEIRGDFPGLLISKTGQTPLAGECLVMAFPSKKGEGTIIAVVLGAENKFEQMKTMIDWAYKTHKF